MPSMLAIAGHDRSARPRGLHAIERELLFWTYHAASLIVVAAIARGILQKTQVGDGFPTLWLRFAVATAAAVALRAAYETVWFRQGTWPKRWAAGVLLSGLAGLTERLASPPLAALVLPAEAINTAALEGVWPGWLLLSLGWSAGYLAICERAGLRAETSRVWRLVEAAHVGERESLASLMRPHLMFNALGALVACRRDPAAVSQIAGSLSACLQHALADGGAAVPVGREVDLLEHYLALERVRFEDAFDCSIDCPPETRELLGPAMLLQPLVENAIHYGMRTSPGRLVIAITARIEGPDLEVEVCNTGSWVTDGDETPGLALANLRRRLELFDPRARLEVTAADGRVRVTASLPRRRAAAG